MFADWHDICTDWSMEGELHCSSWDSCPRDDGVGQVAGVKCPKASDIKYALHTGDILFSFCVCKLYWVPLLFCSCCPWWLPLGKLGVWSSTGEPSSIDFRDNSVTVAINYLNILILCTQPKVTAVLDWEICALGDPLADVGFFAMTYLPFASPVSLGECSTGHWCWLSYCRALHCFLSAIQHMTVHGSQKKSVPCKYVSTQFSVVTCKIKGGWMPSCWVVLAVFASLLLGGT